MMSFLAFALNFFTANAEVHDLTADNFAKFISENENTLVKFYAPRCGHCKAMKEDYIKASDNKEVTEANVKFAEIDATAHQEIGMKFGVQGYPTIKYFHNGVPTDYDSGRKEDDFVKFVKMMTSDAVVRSASIAEARAERRAGDVSFIAVCTAEGAECKKFEEIATANRMLGQFHQVEGTDNHVIVVREDGEETISLDVEDLLARIKVEKLPHFGPVSGENFGSYMETGLDMIWLAGSTADFESMKAEITVAAKELRGKFNFVHIDSGVFGRQIEGMLGLSESELPKLVRTRDGPGKFIFEGEMKGEEIINWMKKVTDGEVDAVLKSEDIPAENDDVITTVVGKNFDNVVTNDKDVFLMIHAPWCGHCKNFMPEFKAAAEEVSKKSPETVMALLDGTANELSNEEYIWTGFPTVYFKKAGSDKPMKYSGARDAAGVLEFLKNNVKTPFEYTLPVKEEDKEAVDDEL